MPDDMNACMQVVLPHYEIVCQNKGLQKGEQPMLLEIDVYSVHISQDFRDWIREQYSFIHICYVPGVTPVFCCLLVVAILQKVLLPFAPYNVRQT